MPPPSVASVRLSPPLLLASHWSHRPAAAADRLRPPVAAAAAADFRPSGPAFFAPRLASATALRRSRGRARVCNCGQIEALFVHSTGSICAVPVGLHLASIRPSVGLLCTHGSDLIRLKILNMEPIDDGWLFFAISD